MLKFFTFRSTNADDNPDVKRWLYRELMSGRLRQGWFSEVSLVTEQCQAVTRKRWISQARAAVKKWSWAKGSDLARFKGEAFCPEKYNELSTMTRIDGGDVIVIPGVDSSGGKTGFVMASAVRSRRTSWSKGCYWYDMGRLKYDYRHVLDVRVVDPGRAFFPNAEHESISKNLEHRSKPVQRIKTEVLVKHLSDLGSQPDPPGPLPKFRLAKQKQSREKIERQIAARQGQGPFRENLLIVYKKQCAISTCDVVDALEAAHIVPHNVSGLDDVRNGILLRADLHTLLDRGLLTINPRTRKVELHPIVRHAYREYHGLVVREATPPSRRPDVSALRHHYRQFQQRLNS